MIKTRKKEIISQNLIPKSLRDLDKSEFSLAVPGIGGLSGSCRRRVVSADLKLLNVFFRFTAFGREFHSRAPFTWKESSYRLWYFCLLVMITGGTLQHLPLLRVE